MILSDKAAAARLNSSGNLMNRLDSLKNGSNRKSAMSLFIPSSESKRTVDISVPKKQEKESKVSFNPFEKTPVIPAPLVKTNVEETPTLDTLIESPDNQVKLSLAHNKALELLTNSVDTLAAKLDDVKADKLPGVIAAASKVVESIRRERIEANKSSKEKEVHYHFYTPQQKKLTDYEIIDVQTVSPQ